LAIGVIRQRDYRKPVLTKSMELLTFGAIARHNPISMHWALQLVIGLAVLALAGAGVALLLAARRAAVRAERVLDVVERDLPPLAVEARELATDLRRLSRQIHDEVGRVSLLTARAAELADGVGRIVSGVAGLTRAGQLVGIAAGLKTGLEVFLHRLRRHEGDNHG
jgi:hypothetical protein